MKPRLITPEAVMERTPSRSGLRQKSSHCVGDPTVGLTFFLWLKGWGEKTKCYVAFFQYKYLQQQLNANTGTFKFINQISPNDFHWERFGSGFVVDTTIAPPSWQLCCRGSLLKRSLYLSIQNTVTKYKIKMAKYRYKIQIHNGKQKYTNVQVDSFVVGDSFKALL